MRASGVLMHISSLPSPYGIGTFGTAAYEFVDFLEASGQSFWQILPFGQAGFGDSPYQSFSTHAGNPYFIDLDILREQGVLEGEEYWHTTWGEKPEQVNFGLLYEKRYPVLRLASGRFLDQLQVGQETERQIEFDHFCQRESRWLEDYALFMALKEHHGGAPWYEWEPQLKKREQGALEESRRNLKEEIGFWKVLQFWFFQQWYAVKGYANEKGIQIIGDVPIYVAGDSADIWANPEQFQLDENLEMVKVAGCPPDAFSPLGQLWGNPLFRWDYMKERGYDWWIGRIDYAARLYDILRIDHFRGFDSYYAIPKGMTDAREGSWEQGPGIDFFRTIEEQCGKLSIIAEDLGCLFDSVRRLVTESGFPGMKVLQFAFDTTRNSDYLPHKYGKNCVVYAGTHDNNTILGWMQDAPAQDTNFAKIYLGLSHEEGYHWGMMRGGLASAGDLVILTMQDILGLDGSARMNTPSTLGGNWIWRMKGDAISREISQKLREYTAIYGRLRQQ